MTNRKLPGTVRIGEFFFVRAMPPVPYQNVSVSGASVNELNTALAFLK